MSRYSSGERSEADSVDSDLLHGPRDHSDGQAVAFDVDVLIAKLEQYKSSLEEANNRLHRRRSASRHEDSKTRLERQKSLSRLEQTNNLQGQKSLSPNEAALSPKEAAAVAAAARFRQEIERGALDPTPPLSAIKRMFDVNIDSPRSPLSPILDTGDFSVLPDNAGGGDDTSKSANFPTRSSSIARRPSSLAKRRQLARLPAPLRPDTGQANPEGPTLPLQAQTVQAMTQRPRAKIAQTSPQRSQELLQPNTEKLPDLITSGSVKKHKRSITIGDRRHSISSTIFSAPARSDSRDGAVQLHPDSVDVKPPIRHSPLLMAHPMEDQVRRELEALAIKEGTVLLEQNKRDSGWRTPLTTVHVIELETGIVAEKEEELRQPMRRAQTQPVYTAAEDFVWRTNDTGSGLLRFGRKFSIFRSFRKRTTADELIEMYMSDEQLKELRGGKGKGMKEKAAKEKATKEKGRKLKGFR